jgi:tripartite-type tricarboxylate transporter receptor subunit TctC
MAVLMLGPRHSAASSGRPQRIMYANTLRGVTAMGETSMKAVSVISALLAGTLLGALASPAAADDVADFYRGKRISLIIGYGSGGGYDIYARMLGRFIGEHIPGKPSVVPQNMPGAGSRSAANWLYKIAPKDGTVIATLGQATPTDQALGQPGVQFDARKFNWIGNLAVVNNFMFVWAETGVKTIDDAKKKSLAIGASGASSPSVLYPQVSNNLLGTKFKIVAGYPGGGDINIAVERREVDGRGSDSWASMKSTHPDWIKDHKINILFQVGPKREADLPDVPLWSELGQNDDQRQVLEILSGDAAVGRPILTAPDVPADRVKALRKAFDDTLRDPAFIEAAKQANMYFNPMPGEELQQVVNKIASPPERILALVKQAIEIKDVQKKGQ